MPIFRAFILATALLINSATARDSDFCFRSPGHLSSRDAAQGNVDRTIYLPTMAFPLKVGPRSNGYTAHLNSQIFGYGGEFGPGGSQKDERNYAGCWQDTYCEGKRSWKMPLCPLGKGHQGDDIRPHEYSDIPLYPAVAFANGHVSLITNNTTVIVVSDEDGTECRYLHMAPDSIDRSLLGKAVVKGVTVLGMVSNIMNGRPDTTRHLHFDCRQTFDLGNGRSRAYFVPIYTSLVKAYANDWGIGDLDTSDDILQPGSAHEEND